MSDQDFDFQVDYAKSARSKCNTCKDTIDKTVLRLAKMYTSNFDRKIPRWHHVKCFFAKGNQGLTELEMIYNIDTVRPDDQDKITRRMNKWGAPKEEEVKGKKKRKREDDDEEKPVKKRKIEDPLAAKKREEGEVMWNVKDALKNGCKNSDLREMLEGNKQKREGGESDILERCAFGMVFGRLPKCEECENGHIIFESGKYRCTGHANEWAHCTFESLDVELEPWKIPKSLKKKLGKIKFFQSWEFEPRKKVTWEAEIKKLTPSQENAVEGVPTRERKFFKLGEETKSPLEGYVLAYVGKFDESRTELQERAEKLGAKTQSSCTVKVTHLISDKRSIKKNVGAVKKALKYDIPIMSQDWIFEAEEREEVLNENDYMIGGSEYAYASLEKAFSDPKDDKMEVEETVLKVRIKGRTAVDAAAEDYIEKYHVLDLGDKDIYDVTLNVTDITKGYNSFYAMQILQHDERKKWVVFRKWGRVGAKNFGTKFTEYTRQSEAISEFLSVFEDKTGSTFKKFKKGDFKKVPGKFYPIEKALKSEQDEMDAIEDKMNNSSSSLDKRVQGLIRKIFDIKLMKQSLLEMEIDLKKMPLGTLSKDHIQKGYRVLQEIDDVLQDKDLSEKQLKNEILSLSNQFYTLIPHNFGDNPVTLIDDQEHLETKMKLMEALIDIEIATTLLKSDGDESASMIDSNYEKLKTDLQPLDPSDEEYEMCDTYMKNQQGRFSLETLNVFKVDREGADERFREDLENKYLLWHGSRLTNYVGILSQGLRIAPPEAPKTGYRFGKGIYLADICEKSAIYCYGKRGDTILMMLIESALGTPKELLRDQYMEQPLPGSDSTKAMGGMAPDPTSTRIMNGITIPLGIPKSTGIKSACQHNEYIIYDTSQAKIKYLLELQVVRPH